MSSRHKIAIAPVVVVYLVALRDNWLVGVIGVDLMLTTWVIHRALWGTWRVPEQAKSTAKPIESSPAGRPQVPR